MLNKCFLSINLQKKYFVLGRRDDAGSGVSTGAGGAGRQEADYGRELPRETIHPPSPLHLTPPSNPPRSTRSRSVHYGLAGGPVPSQRFSDF